MEKKLIANDVLDIVAKHKDNPGIDVRKLKPGTRLKVRTTFSLYEFEVTNEPGYLIAQGGKHIKGKQKVFLSGSTHGGSMLRLGCSTHGGSMLRLGWIGQLMNMEMWFDTKRFMTTSKVRKATVIGDGWEYSLGD